MSTDSIKYQVLTPEYVESAIQCSIICKAAPGNTYTDFQIPHEYVERSVRSYFASDIAYKFTIIAIDESIGNKVVGVVQGMDIMDYDKIVKSESSHKKMNVLLKVSARLTEDPRSQIKQYGECVYGNSMGVLPQYRNKNMSTQLLKFFIFRCFELGYKQYIGLMYNPQMQHIMDKHSVQVVCELNPEDCLDLDPKIREYFTRKYISVLYFFDETASLANRYSKQKQFFLQQVRPHL